MRPSCRWLLYTSVTQSLRGSGVRYVYSEVNNRRHVWPFCFWLAYCFGFLVHSFTKRSEMHDDPISPPDLGQMCTCLDSNTFIPSLLILSSVLKHSNYSQKVHTLLVLLVAPAKTNQTQKSIWVQNNYIFDSCLFPSDPWLNIPTQY